MKTHRTRTSLLATFCSFLVCSLILLPMYANAAELVPCGGADEESCTFDHLIIMVNTLIEFLLYKVAFPLSAVAFMVVGINLMLHQDKEGAWSEAKEKFSRLGIGFFWMIAAFLAVKAILVAFVKPNEGGMINFILGF